MNSRIFLSLALFGALTLASFATQTAQVRLLCGSLRFSSGTEPAGALLNLTSIAPAVNGELRPYATPDYAYKSDFNISNNFGGGGLVSGSLTLILPISGDRDTNGIHDFYETAEPVAWTNTLGTFTSSAGNGSLTATWLRSSGVVTGICLLSFQFEATNQSETFTCPFALMDYTGYLNYQLGSNGVSAAAVLTQTGFVTNTLNANMFFTRITNSYTSELSLSAGGFNNALGQVLPFPTIPFTRMLPTMFSVYSPTTFFGVFNASDGDPQTVAADYPFWLLTVDDPHDADLDGIPDLADQYFAQPPRPPYLEFVNEGPNTFLQLSGDVGRRHEIQESDALTSTNWQTVATFTLMSDPVLLNMPELNAPAKFWRAVAR